MQTVIGKTYYQVPRFETLRDLIRYSVEKYGDTPAYRYHDKPGGPDVVRTYREFGQAIDEMGTGLLAMGFAGEHLVVVGENSYEWAIANTAIVNGVGITVPLDKQLPVSEVINLTQRGKAVAFIYHPKHHEIAKMVAQAVPQVRSLICMKADIIEPELAQADARFTDMDQVRAAGRAALAAGDRSFVDAVIDPEKMSSLLFTSGTTAMSKGVMLCHRNITHNVFAVMSTIKLEAGQRALSVLPLHHTFENTVGMYMMLGFGINICFTDGLRYLVDNMKEWKINIILAVPLLFENIYHAVQKKLVKSGKLALVNKLRVVARLLRKVGIDIRKKLFHQIHEGVGGGLSLCVSGAAAIDKEITAFFNDIGIEFWAGYGLTETSPVISCNNYFVNVYGSVGNPLATIEVGIDADSDEPGAIGEILSKSPSNMLGYYENPEATAEVLTSDGWVRTGDIGYLDKQGCIFITGRKKSMIVLPNGKKAFPEEIEFVVNRIPGVKESIVWGDELNRDTIDICAKIVFSDELLPEGLAGDSEKISAYLAEQIKLVNKDMPVYKAVRNFVWTTEELIKTTTLKVKRPEESKKIKAWLDEHQTTMRAKTGQRMS
ncbi:MAG: AMP-binding protein [Eubacteriales bacterium]|nr:AMP-binding protein [Eubacteriales bacterium]